MFGEARRKSLVEAINKKMTDMEISSTAMATIQPSCGLEATACASGNDNCYKILALVPRGLEKDVSNQIMQKSLASHPHGDNHAELQISILDRDEPDYGQLALERFVEKQERKKKQQSPWCRHPVGTVNVNPTVHVNIGYDNHPNEDKDSMHHDVCWACPGQFVGTVWLQVSSKDLDFINSIASLRCIGPLLSLVRVGSLPNRQEQQPKADDENNNNNSSSRPDGNSLEGLTRRFTQWISKDDTYHQELTKAITVWKRHVQTCWKDQIIIQSSVDNYEALQERIEQNRLRFRISCIRETPAGTTSTKNKLKKKKAACTASATTTTTEATTSTSSPSSFTRQDLVKSIMDACSDVLVPRYQSSKLNNKLDNKDGWQVDLELYDLELVLIFAEHDKVAIGISMCPHSFLKSHSFATGSYLPPDITPPYLGGDVLSAGIVRLRPTTAHSLLQIATLQPGDVVLDPCAGIGTIPIEADNFYGRVIGLGGDVVLHHPQLLTAASALEEATATMRRTIAADGTTTSMVTDSAAHPMDTADPTSSSSRRTSSLLAAWDATYLPIRTSSVDAVVSDLPFGKQCLSASALNQLLPLILLQCARVLVKGTGRLVVLCGSPQAIWKALEEVEYMCGSCYFVQPCTRISPVSIGGIIAWLVRIERNDQLFEESCTTKFVPRIQKVAMKRARIAQLQKNTAKDNNEKSSSSNENDKKKETKKRKIVQS